MATFRNRDVAARHFGKKSVRTIDAWLAAGYITGFKADDGSIHVDLDEIERALRVNPKMRDGRQPFGPKARIVQMPIVPEPKAPGSDQ